MLHRSPITTPGCRVTRSPMTDVLADGDSRMNRQLLAKDTVPCPDNEIVAYAR